MGAERGTVAPMNPAVVVRDLELPGANAETRRVSFDLEPGDVVAIAGPPGVGKSTLLRMLSGQLPGQAGELRVMNIDVKREPRRAWESTGYLCGDRQPFVWSISALENLRHHATMKRLGAARIDRQVRLQLQRVGLGHVSDHTPRGFEPDDRLRLSMAHAWLDDPMLLLLDDPLHAAGTEAADQFMTTFDAWIEADPRHCAIVTGRSLRPFVERCTRAYLLRERWLAPIAPHNLP